jgi:hypothetical protein
VDAFNGGNLAQALLRAHPLFGARLQVHLDTPQSFVVKRDVLECRRIEVASCDRVQVAQNVAVERRGHAERVVVRGLEARDVLLRIRTDQQSAAEPAVRTDASQNSSVLGAKRRCSSPGRKRHRARVDGFVHVESPRKSVTSPISSASETSM